MLEKAKCGTGHIGVEIHPRNFLILMLLWRTSTKHKNIW